MVTVYGIRLEFGMEEEAFARELYGRWEEFFRSGVEEVMEAVFSRYDGEDEVIRVGSLEVELGTVPQEEFYERFPKLLTERLETVFGELLRHREAYPVEIVSLRRDGLQAFLYFLVQGVLPGNVPESYRDLHRLLELVTGSNGYELGAGLKRWGIKEEVCCRLVRQFRDEELEKVVEVTEPSEAVFIRVYTRSLLGVWPRLKRPEVASGDYRNVVWEVVWAYLLCEGRSFFSRKQLVRQTIAGLAARFNLGFSYLLGLLTNGVRRMVSGWLVMPELAAILMEIRKEANVTGGERLRELMVEGTTVGEEVERWKRWLAHPNFCRRLLAPMREEEIYRLVEAVVPSEGAFVISYARMLDREERVGMLEGKAGAEFRLLKWEFIFLVVMEAPASAFSRKEFVRSVLSRMSAHYNVSLRELLDYFSRAIGTRRTDFTAGLAEILAGLWKEEVGCEWEAEEKPLKELSVRKESGDELWKAETVQGEEVTFYVANAGVVLLSPYFPRLFSLLGWVEDGVFTGEEAQVRAIFAMQYLTFGQTEFPELELTLNKLLVSWRREEPLPLSAEFTKKEKEVMDSLLEGAMGNWKMMEHTSVAGFRGSFLIRNGVVRETGELWQLTVEEKAYDVLLDSLPWNFSPVKFPWMEKVLYVNWRK